MKTYEALPQTTIIGIGHKAGHGKDTAAQALIEHRPDLVRRYAFADGLKAYCRIVSGMTVKDSPLLQTVGQDLRRTYPAVLSDAVYWQIRDDDPCFAVITDVRHVNEAEFIMGLGGYLLKVTRLVNDVPFVASDRDPNHPTETALNDWTHWDGHIENRHLADLPGLAVAWFEDLRDALTWEQRGVDKLPPTQ